MALSIIRSQTWQEVLKFKHNLVLLLLWPCHAMMLQPLTSQMYARLSLLPLSTCCPQGLKQDLTQKLSVRWPVRVATGSWSRPNRLYR
jgi:hypothetical protein